jgi:hypothetical protein
MSERDIAQEIDEVAGELEKSVKSPKEILIDTIRELGPEGLRKALPELDNSEKELLKEALEDMKKVVSMDDAYAAKVIQGKIDDTKLQEEVANDDQDEKLVKPEAAKIAHQGTPTEGWEGQVIKAKGDMSREEAKSKLMEMEEKEHGTKNPKKLVEAEEEEQDEKKVKKAHVGFKAVEEKAREEGAEDPKAVAAAVGIKKYGKAGMEAKAQAGKMKKGEDKMKKMCKCGAPAAEGLMKCMGCVKAMKKSIELELGDKATPELVKAEMKNRLLAEESQLGDAPDMSGAKVRGNEEAPEALKPGKDNEAAQKKVNDLSQGQEGSMSKAKAPKELDLAEDNEEAQKKVNDEKQGKKEKMKKAIWTSENDLLKAGTNGRNFHYSINDMYDDAIRETQKPVVEQPLMKSGDKKEDLNDIIAKGGDATWGQVETDRLVKANEAKVSGKFTKSFVDADLAEAFGMTIEEVKKIIGE